VDNIFLNFFLKKLSVKKNISENVVMSGQLPGTHGEKCYNTPITISRTQNADSVHYGFSVSMLLLVSKYVVFKINGCIAQIRNRNES